MFSTVENKCYHGNSRPRAFSNTWPSIRVPFVLRSVALRAAELMPCSAAGLTSWWSAVVASTRGGECRRGRCSVHVKTKRYRKAKAQQTNQLHPGQLFFSREKEEMPWVGFEPTTLCSLGERSIPTELPGQLSWYRGSNLQHNTRQRQTSNHCAMAQYTLTHPRLVLRPRRCQVIVVVVVVVVVVCGGPHKLVL